MDSKRKNKKWTKEEDIFSIFNINFPNKILKAEKNAEKIGLVFFGIKNREGNFIKVWKGNNKKYWYKCIKCKRISKRTGGSVQQKRAGCHFCSQKQRFCSQKQ